MPPLQQARQFYLEHGRMLEEDLAAFLHGSGYVVKRPDALMLFRPAHTDNINVWIPEDQANAWFVHLAVGRVGVRWFLEQAPRSMPFLVWYRNFAGPARVYSTQRFRKFL